MIAAMTIKSVENATGTAVRKDAKKSKKTGIIAPKNKIPVALYSKMIVNISLPPASAAYAALIPVHGRKIIERPPKRPAKVPAAVAKNVFPSTNENMEAVVTAMPPSGKPTLR